MNPEKAIYGIIDLIASVEIHRQKTERDSETPLTGLSQANIAE
jgi:hypothetical protein